MGGRGGLRPRGARGRGPGGGGGQCRLPGPCRAQAAGNPAEGAPGSSRAGPSSSGRPRGPSGFGAGALGADAGPGAARGPAGGVEAGVEGGEEGEGGGEGPAYNPFALASIKAAGQLPIPLYVLSMTPALLRKTKIAKRTLETCVSQGLVNCVMLGDGPISGRELRPLAMELQGWCRDLGVKFLVDSRVEVAAAVGADGVQLDFDLDVEETRNFLDTVINQDDGGSNIISLDNQNGLPKTWQDYDAYRKCLVGRSIHSEQDALLAEVEMCDFVVVEKDMATGAYYDGSDDDSEDRRARMGLRELRRKVSCLLIVSHEFCIVAGGPKRALMAGADGLFVPAERVASVLEKQDGVLDMTMELPSGDRLLGAILLIAGGTVGAGIIALPVKTFAAGFVPSAVMLTVCWLFMTLTALMLVELSIWFGPGTNLTSMASKTLGTPAKVVTIVLYLFIYLATMTAYIAESGSYLVPVFSALGLSVPAQFLSIGFTAVVGSLLCAGTYATELTNRICLAVAIVAYCLLLAMGSQFLDLGLLGAMNWGGVTKTIPLMVVAFTFHNIVPSLLSYLGTAKRVSQAIVFGSLIPLVMYVLWEVVILGTLPRDVPVGSTQDIIRRLMAVAGTKVVAAVQTFSFFAIITSFLGVGLGCVDFIGDLCFAGMNVQAAAQNTKPRLSAVQQRVASFLMITIPSLVAGVLFQDIFLAALDYSGTLRLILFSVLPVLMLWRGRYKDGRQAWLPGGKWLLGGVLGATVSVISVEVLNKLNLLPLVGAALRKALPLP